MEKELDIFDELESETEEGDEDSFVKELKGQIDSLTDKIKAYSKSKQDDKRFITKEIKAAIEKELSKIKPINVVSKVIEKQPIIKEVEVPSKEKEKEIIKEIIRDPDNSAIEALKREFESYKKMVDKDAKDKIKAMEEKMETLRSQVEDIPMPGGPGVIGIPAPEGKNGQVLSVNKNSSEWSATIPFGTNWRAREDSNGDLVFEKLVSGTWTEAGGYYL